MTRAEKIADRRPGVVVTDDLVVIQFRGRTAPFLEHAPGAATLDLLRTVREELRLPLRRAIDKARAANNPARESGISLFGGEGPRTVMLEVTPFAVHSARLFLVLFTEEAVNRGEPRLGNRASSQDAERISESSLQQELTATRQYLESVIEQLEATNEELKAANEEIVSSNEELRSGNEELESAKEELQATNEELRTLNDEMQDRSTEATRLSDDLTNVLSSAEIPIVIVGRDSRIRRFTPAAGKVFGLAPADLGRSLSEVRHISAIADVLSPIVKEVLEQLRSLDSTIQDRHGRWHQLWVRPYKTLDGRIDGTVIAARDIDAEKRSAEGLVAARKYAEDVVEAIRDGIVVLDAEMRVTSANRAFLRALKVEAEEVSGRRLHELGRPERRRRQRGVRRRASMKVVLADDHRMVRDGLRAALERAGVEVVGEAATGHEALAEVRRKRPDVVVMDIGMPELNGIDATKRMVVELPGTKVLGLSMNADRRYVIAMLEAGAAGYLLKNSASEELLNALDAVARGETYLSSAITGSVVARAIQGSPATRSSAERPLTVREREVLQLVAEGKSSKEIGVILHIAVPTVETHRRQIVEKLSLRTIAELTKYAIREGLTSTER